MSIDERRTKSTLCACLLLGAFTLLLPSAAAAHPAASEAVTAKSGRTYGHAQIGLALFDRTGTLERETDERGFAPWGGGTLRLGFVHYLAAVPWLGFGAGVRGTFGSSSSGDEEYYFNPIFTSGTIAGFLPLGPRNSGFELQCDLGFTNVLAKSKVLTAEGTRVLHEYGIGPGFGLLAGYRWYVERLGTGLTLSVQHSRHFVNVDVDRAASKTWALGVTSVLAGFAW